MTQFKKMKMRINNPDHSKAVQEWLFEQGYEWSGNIPKQIQKTEATFLFTGTYSPLSITSSFQVDSFHNNEGTETDISHLDPHLYKVHKSTCVPAKSYTEKPKMKSEFEKLSQQLKHLDKAIDSHENKQNKRKLGRQRIIEKMESMLPEGYGLVRGLEVKLDDSQVYSGGIVEGSEWE